MVTLQFLDGDHLKLVGAFGFKQPFLDFFDTVKGNECACGTALESRRQIVVPDVDSSEIFAGKPSLAVMREAGSAAVVSTPLIGRDGKLLGMSSIHKRSMFDPTEIELETFRWVAHAISAAFSDPSSAQARMLRTVAKWERVENDRSPD
jgi:GAF domain-containing protein